MKEILITLFRTIFFYFFVLLSYRIMGKRELGELSIIDLIISLLIAELVAISIENTGDTILMTIIPIIALTLLEIGLDYLSLKSKRVKTFFEGKPSIIISEGKVNYKEMVKQRYSIDDLLLELRQKGIKSLENIEYAMLESNGKLSIFEKKIFDTSYPMPLIVDGVIQINTLKAIKKSRMWLLSFLHKNNLELKDIFYCFYKKYKFFVIKRSDLVKID